MTEPQPPARARAESITGMRDRIETHLRLFREMSQDVMDNAASLNTTFATLHGSTDQSPNTPIALEKAIATSKRLHRQVSVLSQTNHVFKLIGEIEGRVAACRETCASGAHDTTPLSDTLLDTKNTLMHILYPERQQGKRDSSDSRESMDSTSERVCLVCSNKEVCDRLWRLLAAVQEITLHGWSRRVSDHSADVQAAFKVAGDIVRTGGSSGGEVVVQAGPDHATELVLHSLHEIREASALLRTCEDIEKRLVKVLPPRGGKGTFVIAQAVQTLCASLPEFTVPEFQAPENAQQSQSLLDSPTVLRARHVTAALSHSARDAWTTLSFALKCQDTEPANQTHQLAKLLHASHISPTVVCTAVWNLLHGVLAKEWPKMNNSHAIAAADVEAVGLLWSFLTHGACFGPLPEQMIDEFISSAKLALHENDFVLSIACALAPTKQNQTLWESAICTVVTAHPSPATGFSRCVHALAVVCAFSQPTTSDELILGLLSLALQTATACSHVQDTTQRAQVSRDTVRQILNEWDSMRENESAACVNKPLGAMWVAVCCPVLKKGLAALMESTKSSFSSISPRNAASTSSAGQSAAKASKRKPRAGDDI